MSTNHKILNLVPDFDDWLKIFLVPKIECVSLVLDVERLQYVSSEHGTCADLCTGDFQRYCAGVVKRCVFKNDEIFEPVGRLKPLKIVLDVKLRVVSLFLGFEI